MASTTPSHRTRRREALAGCLLGTAVGDAIGLPAEGLPRARQQRLFGRIEGHRFLLGRGMVSDDTDHACLTAQALIESGGAPDLFAASLARGLRVWLLGIPAGVGMATLRGILKLWAGVPPSRSGVPSAGNGPAMRAPILGVAWGHDPQRLRELVRISTRVTHTDPRAEHGALAAALAAHHAAASAARAPDAAAYLDTLGALLGTEGAEMLDLARRAATSAAAGESTETFAASIGAGAGIGGYVYHTVPAVLHAWLRHGTDFRAAILEIVHCGGDTDSTAAVLGGIVGAGAGREGIPADWLAGLWDWPRGIAWMERLAGILAEGRAGRAPRIPYPAVLARNTFFLAVVLAHGFRRLGPPYGRGAAGPVGSRT